jgi:hypothetical protein
MKRVAVFEACGDTEKPLPEISENPMSRFCQCIVVLYIYNYIYILLYVVNSIYIYTDQLTELLLFRTQTVYTLYDLSVMFSLKATECHRATGHETKSADQAAP